MITNKKVKVSTGGKQVGEATIPLFPEKIEDIAQVFKATPAIALSCLQNGLTIRYQGVLRNKYAKRTAKPSKQKLELIAKCKANGYYKEDYEDMNVRGIMNDTLENLK